MSNQIDKLRVKLNPIIAARITAREQELIMAIRAVTDEAIKANQYGGSRMALGLEVVYRTELTQQGLLVWETMIQAIDGLHPYQPGVAPFERTHYVLFKGEVR